MESDADEALLEVVGMAEEVDVVDDSFADSVGQDKTVIVVAEVPPWTVTVDVLMVVAADALEAGAVTVLMIVVVVTLLLIAYIRCLVLTFCDRSCVHIPVCGGN